MKEIWDDATYAFHSLQTKRFLLAYNNSSLRKSQRTKKLDERMSVFNTWNNISFGSFVRLCCNESNSLCDEIWKNLIFNEYKCIHIYMTRIKRANRIFFLRFFWFCCWFKAFSIVVRFPCLISLEYPLFLFMEMNLCVLNLCVLKFFTCFINCCYIVSFSQ